MKAKKITISQALPGTKVLLNGKTFNILRYEGIMDMLYKDYMIGSFNYNEVTITERPKKYGDSGVMVRFSVPNLDGEYLLFWSEFKNLIDITIEQRISNIDLILSNV